MWSDGFHYHKRHMEFDMHCSESLDPFRECCTLSDIKTSIDLYDLRPAWSAWRVPGCTGLHRETLFQKKRNREIVMEVASVAWQRRVLRGR